MAVYPLQSSNVFSYTFGGHLAPARTGSPGDHLLTYPGVSFLYAANDNPVLNIGGQSWTIEFWVKPNGTGIRTQDAIHSPYACLFSKRLGGQGTAGTSYFGYIKNNPTVIGYYNGTEYFSSTRLTPNVWTHVAYVFNQGANLRIFLNGSNVLTTTAVTSTLNINSRFYIGRNDDEAAQFCGDISNFRIVSGQALYSGESFLVSTLPLQLPNNSIGPHAFGSNVAASLTGNVVLLTCNDQIIKSNGNTVLNGAYVNSGISVCGFVYPHAVDNFEVQNFSYYYPGNTALTGQNGTVLVTSTTNSLNLNADFTIETWFYPQTNTGVLLERGYAGVGNNSASYILIWDTPNNNINFAVANANNNTYSVGALTGSAGSLGAPTLNAWNHIAVTRAGNTYRGFLNGALTFTPGTNANTPYAALGRGLTIGGMFNNGQTYATGIPANTITGYISNLRIIRGNSIYNAAFTPSNTQSWNVTNTILLTGLTPAFEDLSGNHTLATNGASEIFFSTATPFTANSIVNANSSVGLSTQGPATGNELGRIYNKFDYNLYAAGTPSLLFATGNELGRIYNKFDYNFFAVTTSGSMRAYTTGNELGRIYNKFDYNFFATTTSASTRAYTVGNELGRIYDRYNTNIFAVSAPFRIYTTGNELGRIRSKINDIFYGYLSAVPPVNYGATPNTDFEFWS